MSGVKGMKHRKKVVVRRTPVTPKVDESTIVEDLIPLNNITAITMMKADRIRSIMEGMLDIFIAKNSDYGDSFSRSIEDFGITAGIVRIGDKYNRIRNLTKRSVQQVMDESVTDTLVDLANYCIMTVMELQLAKDKESRV